MNHRRRRPLSPRPRLDVTTLEARRLLTTLVAIVDTGVDLNSTSDAPYYDLAQGFDAYRQRSVAQYGSSVVQDNGSTGGGTGHFHGSTIADEVVQAFQDTKAAAGAGSADVAILPIRATDDNGNYDTGALIRGIRYAADEGAAAIDLSFRASGEFYSNITGESLTSAIKYAGSKGTVVSVAAANDHMNVDDLSNPVTIYPLAIRSPNMLVSAAVDGNGALSWASNWGPQRVDLGAPAIGGYTSFAAGYTAGVTGVVAALTPGMSATDRVNLIKATVTPTAQSVGAWSTTGGVINPAAAVAKALQSSGGGGTTTPTPGPPTTTTTPAPAPILIAAGSATGSGGYVGDGPYISAGNTFSTTHAIDASGVTDPAPAAVYQNERWTGGTMAYTIPNLTPGAPYTVRLDFAENFYNSAGQRTFNVAVNGATALSQFDIFAAAGGQFKAVSRSVTTTADAAGQVIVTLTNVEGGAKVDAIRITPGTVTGTPPTTTATAVSLAGAFNAVGITADSATGGGNLDGAGNSYSGTVLGSTVTAGGVAYNLGAAGSSDAVKANGQTVALTAGSYSSLRFLGTGVNGTQSGTFTVRYTDGTSTTARQTFSDWYIPTGASNEAAAATTAYRNARSGRDTYYSNFSLYSYTIALDSSKTVQSVTLPTNGNVALLAAALVS